MRPVTVAIHENEKAWNLREQNMIRPPVYQRHRYQMITVVRDDTLTEWWHDLGPAEKFPGPEFEVPSFFEHSVAELRSIADGERVRTDWNAFLAEQLAESTLIADFLQSVEENWRVIRNQSVFGPGVTKQRDGFPKKAVEEYANGNSAG